MTGRALVLRGDARTLPLPDASVDLVCTSPPFYALRSYTDTPELCDRCRELIGQGWAYPRPSDEQRDLRQAWPDWDAHVKAEHKPAHYPGQIGSESTPQEYLAALVECTREWMRVLKPSGSIWVDLGDKYGRPGGGADVNPRSLIGAGKGTTRRVRTATNAGGRDKCLMLLPERYRIACVDELGLIARAVVVWSKPNGLPESVTDRVRRSHEDWVHLVKQPRYFAAVDEIREAHSAHTLRYYGPGTSATQRPANAKSNEVNQTQHRLTTVGALGKLPGSVWTIPTEPLTVPDHLGVDHFAAFPTEWPRRIVLGWSPSGICTECGEGRRPVTRIESELLHVQSRTRGRTSLDDVGRGAMGALGSGVNRPVTRQHAAIIGSACACTPYTDHPEVVHDGWVERGWREYHFESWTPAPTRPAVILDPFGGTGTTALVAKALGRIGITVDLSADYGRLAQWRTTDRRELAKALRVPKPPRQVSGQLDLFGEVA